MKQPFSDETLSAYVDGELSASERADVERWLEGSPEAREKLNDFRRLSGLFAGLARTEVPREFPTKVLQLAERRMLIPEVATAATNRRFRRWAFAIGAPVASAAVLVLMLQSHFRGPDDRLPPAGERQPDGDAPFVVDTLQISPRNENQPAKGTVALSDGDALLSEKSGITPSLRGADAPSAFSAPPLTTPLVGVGGGASPAAGDRSPARSAPVSRHFGRLPAGAPLDQLARTNPELVEMINQAMHDNEAPGGENKAVPVVRMYITDSSAEGLVLLQNVLIEHEVLSDREDQAGERGRSAPDSGATEVRRGQQGKEALFVIAEPERLIAAFSEMLASEHPSLRLTVEEPIQIAALDNTLQRRLRRLSEELAAPLSWPREAARAEPAPADKAAAPAEPDAKADAPPRPDAAKSDGKPEFKANARGSSEKKSLAKQRQPADKREISAKGEAPAPASAEGVTKEKKDAAAPPLDRLANGRSLQMIVTVPREIEQRGRVAGMKSRIAPQAAIGEIAAARRVANEPARDERARFDDALDRPAPSMVRVLIVIEHEGKNPPPAAAPAPADKKGPSGGAS